MSLWQEEATEAKPQHHSDFVDIVFKMNCQCVPVDNAAPLASTLTAALPDHSAYGGLAIHPLFGAGSQNGWERPDAANGELLILSKRSRLRLRAQRQHADVIIQQLENTQHDVDGQNLIISTAAIRELTVASTLFARYVHFESEPTAALDEDVFTQLVLKHCDTVNFQPTKMLFGRHQQIAIGRKQLDTRSVLLADVPVEASLALQERTLGNYPLLGCGLFVPHKDTAAVN